jgi:hypothetical protein
MHTYSEWTVWWACVTGMGTPKMHNVVFRPIPAKFPNFHQMAIQFLDIKPTTWWHGLHLVALVKLNPVIVGTEVM